MKECFVFAFLAYCHCFGILVAGVDSWLLLQTADIFKLLTKPVKPLQQFPIILKHEKCIAYKYAGVMFICTASKMSENVFLIRTVLTKLAALIRQCEQRLKSAMQCEFGCTTSAHQITLSQSHKHEAYYPYSSYFEASAYNHNLD